MRKPQSLEAQFLEAVIGENTDLVKAMLLREDIDFNAVNIEDRTALHFAWKKGLSSILEILLESNKIEISKDINHEFFYDSYSIDLVSVSKVWNKYKNKSDFIEGLNG